MRERKRNRKGEIEGDIERREREIKSRGRERESVRVCGPHTENECEKK